MQWLTPVISSTWEAQAEGLQIQGYPGQINKTLFRNFNKIKSTSGVQQWQSTPEFNRQWGEGGMEKSKRDK